MNRAFQGILASLHLRQQLPFVALLLLFLALQWYRVTHLAPPPEYIWDNVYLWGWARDFSQFDFRSFVADSHHLLRWGNWGFASALIALTSDSVLIYYLSTVIPSSLGILLFIHFAWKHTGMVGALLFLIFWFFDALLFRATFQLLPSGAALLPVAIMLTLCSSIVESKKVNTKTLIFLTITMFWLYGTKETHLAYLPGVLILLVTYSRLHNALFLLGGLALGYMIETAFFAQISSDFSLFGRIHSLLNGGQHVTIMTESAHYVKQQTQYFDSGITMRWVSSSGVTPLILFSAFIFTVLVLAQESIKVEIRSWSQDKLLAVLITSFFLCTSFFVISISPLRLGHGIVPRYVTVLMPLAYLLLISVIIKYLSGTPFKYKASMLFLIPFFIAPSIHRYSEYKPYSIVEISKAYDQFGEELSQYECVRAKQRSIVMNQLDLVPTSKRSPNTIHMIGRDENTVYQAPWFIAKADLKRECESMYTIARNITMRY